MATPTADSRPHPTPKPGGLPPISPATLLRAVRRYSIVVAAFVVLAAVAGGLTYWLVPLPKMTASTTYHIHATPPAILNAGAGVNIDFHVYKQQQMAILKSRQVINRALSAPTVADLPMLAPDLTQGDPITYLASKIDIGFPNGPEYMRVSMEGNDGDQMVAILKALNESYMTLAVDKDKSRRLSRLNQLKVLQDQYTEELRQNRASVRKVMESVGSGDPYTISLRERFQEAQLGAAQAQLAKIIGDLRESTVESKMAEATLAQPIPNLPDAVLTDLAKVMPQYDELKKQRDAVAAEMVAISETLAPGIKTPRLEKLESEQKQLDEKLKKLPGELKPDILARYKDTATRTERQRLDANRDKIALMSNMQKALIRDVDELIAKRKDLSGNTLDLEILRDKAVQTESMANRIAAEIEQIKPELDAPTRVSQWEEPVAVMGVEGNRRVKYSGMAAGGILLLGLALVQWLDIRNRRVHSIDEVAAGTGLTVIGSMPRYPRNARGEESASWNHLLAEAVNTTRTMIMAPRGVSGSAPPPVARTILITSASSGEGKTSLTTHLAVSLANAGRRVLLIDADMRRPAAHVVLGLPLTPGLSEYLTKGITAGEASQGCQVPGLTIVAAGKWNEASAAALNGVRWRDLLAAAADEYDFVLIDSPPILPVADALSIARHVDGVLISVMQDQSRYLAVQAACNRLTLVGARMLGVVMAGATTNAGHYYYDRYYSSYKPQPTAAE
jgi:succinoglycan biosynthesis transport protein ExoP